MSDDPHPRSKVDSLPWVALAVAGFFLLSYPWLAPSIQHQYVLGIPLFFVLEFGVWAVLIVAVAFCRRDS